MPILDDRGRLFGRVNLIDAALVLVLLVLIPLAYVSWFFLKTPQVVLETAAPAALRVGIDDQPVKLTGQHLRPFLHAFVGGLKAKYLFESPTNAELRIPVLPVGTYDLILFDETQEVGHLPKALTVVAATPPVVSSVTPAVLEFSR